MENMHKKKISFIDLFAGAGGLSEGFINAGYFPVAHVEMNKDACDTLKTRIAYHYLKKKGLIEEYTKYLRKKITKEYLYSLIPYYILNSVVNMTMTNESMDEIYILVDKSMEHKNISKIDMIIGGPPCQAYSQVGRSRKSMDGDPRNDLYKLYIKMLKRYRPEMILFENVPGLFTAGQGKYLENIKKLLNEEGYDLEIKLQNASEFGVLQNRKRLIIIGWKSGTNHSYPQFQKICHDYFVNDILDDLPGIQAGDESKDYGSLTFSKYLREYDLRNDYDILTWHAARRNIERDREIYKIAIYEWNNGHKRLKYTDLPEKLCTHKNKKCFLDRFKVVAGDLPTSHTMMAHISKDGHYFIHPDIKQARSLSVREAARVQSFPDSYYFEGSRTSAFTQIGNAVPPLMAKKIAIDLCKQFT
jgi:DNA (cytosine-5)-methyltransferase 1